MSEPLNMTFTLRVMQIIADAEWHDAEVYWHPFKMGEQPRFFALCNDFFWWATSDGEEVTPENVEELAKAVADCRSLDEVTGDCYAHLLFCSRQRGMRPQGAFYKHIPKVLWPLFDATGEERKADKEIFGNPVNRPADEATP